MGEQHAPLPFIELEEDLLKQIFLELFDFIRESPSFDRKADQSYSGVLGVIDSVYQALLRKVVDELGYPAFCHIELNGYTLDSQVLLSFEKKEALQFRVRERKSFCLEEITVLAAAYHLRDEVSKVRGLMFEKIVWCIVHTINKYSAARIILSSIFLRPFPIFFSRATCPWL